MFYKYDIRQVSIALEKEFYHEAFRRLGQAAIVHLDRFEMHQGDAEEGLKTEETKVREKIAALEAIMAELGLSTEMVEDQRRHASTSDVEITEKTEACIRGLLGRVTRLQRLRSGIDSQRGRIEEQLPHLRALRDMGIDAGNLRDSRLTVMFFGTVEDDHWMPPETDRLTAARQGSYLFVVTRSEDQPEVAEMLREKGFVDRLREVYGLSLDTLEQRLAMLTSRMEILKGYREQLIRDHGEELPALLEQYRERDEIVQSLRMSLFSSRTMFIRGWVDFRDRDRLEQILRQICGDRFILSLSEEHDPHAPVRLRNMALFRPFELLVKTMGSPANDEIDPTPLAAVTFIVIFALMFGDVGQGLVLALVGYILRRIAVKKGILEGPLGQAGGIMIICGLAASLFGFLYGSVFSHEDLIPALWIHPVDNIMTLFSVTILLGAFIITLGLALNIINSLVNRRYEEAFLEKRGLVILVFYVAVVFFAVRFVATGSTPRLWEMVIFVILPPVLFFLRGFIGPVLFNSHKPHSLLEYFVESSVEILEIGMGMLANTISFIRVGAFALAHAGLGIVTYTLAEMVDPSLRSVGAIVVIIIGNIFIIGFEGLICGIQSLRLEYYEFFSKFFRGDGVVFKPFTLKARTSEV